MPVSIGKQEIGDNLIIQKRIHLIFSQATFNCSGYEPSKQRRALGQGFTANQVPCGNELQNIGSKAGTRTCKSTIGFLLYQFIRHIPATLLRCVNSCRKHLIQDLLNNRKPFTILYEVAFPLFDYPSLWKITPCGGRRAKRAESGGVLQYREVLSKIIGK